MSDRRRENLRALVERFDNYQSFCDRTGLDKPALSRMITGQSAIGNIRARRIEESLDLEQGWLDRSHMENGRKWHDYVCSALAGGSGGDEAIAVADRLIDEYTDRWD